MATEVCVDCGRTKEQEAHATCTTWGWHRQPADDAPDLDVEAEDGDSLLPMTEEELQDAIGPRPGETWADLYARTHLSLSYRSAELAGCSQALQDARDGLALLLRAAGGSVTVTEEDVAAFAPVTHVYRHTDPRAATITWTAAP